MLFLVLVETPQNDADFDLDVRLQEVQYRLSAKGPSVTKIDCTSMGCTGPTNPSACSDWQD